MNLQCYQALDQRHVRGPLTELYARGKIWVFHSNTTVDSSFQTTNQRPAGCGLVNIYRRIQSTTNQTLQQMKNRLQAGCYIADSFYDTAHKHHGGRA